MRASLGENDRAADSADGIGATTATDWADAGFGAVRKALCAVQARARPPEGREWGFDARAALAWTGGGRVWHGRVRARSAVLARPRASCGALREESECRRARGRRPWTGYVAIIMSRVVATAARSFECANAPPFLQVCIFPDCNDFRLTDAFPSSQSQVRLRSSLSPRWGPCGRGVPH